MEALALHTGALPVHWEDNTSCIYVVEDEIVTPRFKHTDITVCFLQDFLIIGFLFQTMRSLVSCRKICAPKHFQVQLSVGVLNG